MSNLDSSAHRTLKKGIALVVLGSAKFSVVRGRSYRYWRSPLCIRPQQLNRSVLVKSSSTLPISDLLDRFEQLELRTKNNE